MNARGDFDIELAGPAGTTAPEAAVRVAVLVSGGGTNLQALIDSKTRGEMPSARLVLVVSSREDASALKRAEQAGIPAQVLPFKQTDDPGQFDRKLLSILVRHRIQLVVLAGFLPVISTGVLAQYSDSIINVHPSLLPSFCGKGFYGLRVHEAALRRGVKISGATVHLVNGEIDGGEILLQKAVSVELGDTPESLQRRVMEQAEWVLLPKAVETMCQRLAKSRPQI